MDERFLSKLYERTREFENWKKEDKYDSFNEAEKALFEVISEAKSRGMNPIGRGGERDVYTGGSVAGNDKVVKISREGLAQNSNAIRVWNDMPEGAREHVAPLCNWSSGYEWLVQVRADGRGDITEVAENLSEYGYEVSDLNGTNVGMYKGKSVLIDLGQLF